MPVDTVNPESRCERVAIFIAPPEDHPWWEFGSRWLGRDVLSETPPPPLTIPAEARATVAVAATAPRRYGFHGTLVPPFALAPGTTIDGLCDAVQGVVRGREAFDVQLAIRELRGFMALVPDPPEPRLDRLAADLLHAVNRFRAPEPPEQQSKRDRPGLTPEERRMLQGWGYPYLLETFRFHMTLTGALDAETLPRILPILREALGTLPSRPLPVRDVCLFHQPSRDAPFRLRDRFGFEGSLRLGGGT